MIILREMLFSKSDPTLGERIDRKIHGTEGEETKRTRKKIKKRKVLRSAAVGALVGGSLAEPGMIGGGRWGKATPTAKSNTVGRLAIGAGIGAITNAAREAFKDEHEQEMREGNEYYDDEVKKPGRDSGKNKLGRGLAAGIVGMKMKQVGGLGAGLASAPLLYKGLELADSRDDEELYEAYRRDKRHQRRLEDSLNDIKKDKNYD